MAYRFRKKPGWEKGPDDTRKFLVTTRRKEGSQDDLWIQPHIFTPELIKLLVEDRIRRSKK